MFFSSKKAGAIKTAKALVRSADKVLRYRRTEIPETSAGEIRALAGEISAALKDPAADPAALGEKTLSLDKRLRKHGGKIYPLGWDADWIETIVIAAILAGGVRVYFFQPFRIPTNSMYPTYHGMTAKVYGDSEPTPAFATRLARQAFLGASHFEPPAPETGEVLIPINFARGGISPKMTVQIPGTNMERVAKGRDSGLFGTGIFPGATEFREIAILPEGGATPVRSRIETPEEFSFDSALLKAFFPKEAALPITEHARWNTIVQNARAAGDIIDAENGLHFIRTHRRVTKGAPLLRFDVLGGDMVFVDRASYHFVMPKHGDAFVFRTRDVPGFRDARDDFFIKRLVGLPGERIAVEDRQLRINGRIASGNPGFDNNNAHRTDLEYYGYLPSIQDGEHDLSGEGVLLGPGRYWAMGDNSANSSDSRKFGDVPQKALVGRALFTLHPFDRTGAAK